MDVVDSVPCPLLKAGYGYMANNAVQQSPTLITTGVWIYASAKTVHLSACSGTPADVPVSESVSRVHRATQPELGYKSAVFTPKRSKKSMLDRVTGRKTPQSW